MRFSDRTYIMGILNVTPDSFSDGGRYNDLEAALDHAIDMAQDGADIIDVGGESTKPGATFVPAAEELERIIPVIKTLAENVDLPISVDTYKAEVAKAAVEAGAQIINDIWGLKKDPEMAGVAAAANVPIVIMHNQEGTYYQHFLTDLVAALQESVDIALTAGVKRENIIIDPGFGFGKTTEQNLYLLKHMECLEKLGLPILVGTSRKSMVGNTLDLPVQERLEGTAATVALAIAKGAAIVRVHDVRAIKRVAEMTDAVTRVSLGGEA